MNKKKSQKSSLKKIGKWVGIVFLLLLILLISAPYLFKDKIKKFVIVTANENINATLDFEDLDLSFIKSFPLAQVNLNQIDLINKAPFKGDTLFHARELVFKMKITELFKGSGTSMNINSFEVNNGLLKILFDAKGNQNYDILIDKTSKPDSLESSQANTLSLNIEEYALNNLNLTYFDESSKMLLNIKEINHKGNGNFKGNQLNLQTQTKAKVSFEMDDVNYMNNVLVSLDALLGIDLKNSKYTFQKNKALINQLPLEFEGFIQLVGNNSDQLYDLEFHTPTSSFKNFLGVIPQQYAGNLANVTTQGDFDISGKVNGILSDKTIPKFDVTIASKNAMFKYKDLPKSVENIALNSRILNTTGSLNDTKVDLNKLTFSIDKDVFTSDAHIYNLVENPTVKMNAKGIVNLNNISQAYPIKLEQKLAGILNANISSAFDMKSIENGNYQKINNSGVLSLNNFKYEDESLANPFQIDRSTVTFSNKSIYLKELKATTGNTDLNIQGKLDNLYGYIFKSELLKGSFNLKSDNVNVNDFMTESVTAKTSKKPKTSKTLKIPAFLDAKFTASVKNVTYDNINLKNASGNLLVKDESVVLEDLKMDAFDGRIQMNGNVSTKDSISNFKMNLNLDNLDVKQSFSQLTTLNTIAPIANVIGGKMKSNFVISGNLSDDLTPNLKTISGNLIGELLNTKVNAKNSNVLSFMDQQFDFIDTSKLNLEKVKTYITFKDGAVVLKPFDVQYKDITINIGGTHGFDKSMNYNVNLNVPAKYLGKDVSKLLSKLSEKEANSMTVPVKAILSGSFSNPKLKTDLKEATSALAKQLVEKQKNKLIKDGKDKLFNFFKKNKKNK